MKKIYFLIFITFNSFSQEIKPLTFEGTIETKKTKKEIYVNAREWFFQNFNNYEGVMSVEDYENGVFYAKGNLPDIFFALKPNRIFSPNVKGNVKFSLRVYFKDNKCKYVFDSFIHEDKSYVSSGITIDNSFGLLTTSDNASNNTRTKLLVELKKIVELKMSDLSIDLIDKINNRNLNDY